MKRKRSLLKDALIAAFFALIIVIGVVYLLLGFGVR